MLLVQAKDPKHPEYGIITIAFTKRPSAPAGLMLEGWTVIDAQNNRSTVRLSDQQFNVPNFGQSVPMERSAPERTEKIMRPFISATGCRA